MQARGELGRGDPEELALATLAALQGGLLLTQMQRSIRPLETALDACTAVVPGRDRGFPRISVCSSGRVIHVVDVYFHARHMRSHSLSTTVTVAGSACWG